MGRYRMRFLLLFLPFFFLSTIPQLYSLEYRAKLEGQAPFEVQKALKEASTLMTLHLGISTIASLKQYMQRDRNEMMDRLKSMGYMEGDIQVQATELKSKSEKIEVLFLLNLGVRYKLGSLGFYVQHPSYIKTKPPSIEDLPSYHKGELVDGELLQALESELISSLSCRGYPHAKLLEAVYDIDTKTKEIHPFYKLDTGSYTTFGPLSIEGNQKIKKPFFLSKIPFKQGDMYNKSILDETEKKFLQTGILTSASFEEKGTAQKNGQQPMTLNIQEAKLHAVGAGVNYMTTLGPGVSLFYDHRYLGNKGQKLGLKFDLWQRKKQATATLTIPSFNTPQQNLLWIAEYDEQTYLPYHSSAEKLSALIEHELSKNVEVLYGARVERLTSTHILSERHNDLFKIPLQIKLSNVKNFLDPRDGATLNVRLTPATQFVSPNFSYLINLTSVTGYTSFFNDYLTIAAKGVYGSIIGSKPEKIPLPDRFYGGNDTILRGYKTGTISPRNRKGEFIGGDSLLAGSLEMRLRQQKGLGWVLFYDLGNSYKRRYPTHNLDPLHSVGAGVRYATPLGPLRFDIAFPLNRRQGVDSLFQIYFSIGQAF